MPTYNYKCSEDGYFELLQRMKYHARANCPTCGISCSQVLLTPPILDTEAMADIGMPGAFSKSGDRMEKRHLAAGQYHTMEYGHDYE